MRKHGREYFNFRVVLFFAGGGLRGVGDFSAGVGDFSAGVGDFSAGVGDFFAGANIS